jgi:hypothetical protein
LSNIVHTVFTEDSLEKYYILFQMLPVFVGNCKHTVSTTKNQAIRQRKMVFSKYFNIFSLPVSLSLIVCLPYQAGLPSSYLPLPISLPFRRNFCLPIPACFPANGAPPSLSFLLAN